MEALPANTTLMANKLRQDWEVGHPAERKGRWERVRHRKLPFRLGRSRMYETEEGTSHVADVEEYK